MGKVHDKASNTSSRSTNDNQRGRYLRKYCKAKETKVIGGVTAFGHKWRLRVLGPKYDVRAS